MRRAIAASLVLFAQVASAEPTKDECIAADTQAQDLRRAGKLHDALAQLDVCMSKACPEMLRADCSERVDEIDRAMPSVVFDVKTSSGVDVADVRVEMDGRLLREHLDGRPVAVDPGAHSFVLTTRGSSRTIEILAHEGDKDRRVAMIVADAAAPPPHASPTPERNAQQPIGVALGATGLAGIALGATLGSLAIAEHADVARICPNNVCASTSDRDSVVAKNAETQTFATIATIAFIVGPVLAAAGLVVYLTAPRRVRVGIAPGAIVGVF